VGDECDMTDLAHENLLQRHIKESSRDIPLGNRGICSVCGYDKPRLIKRVCVQCRDDEDKQITRGVKL
jgi:RNA polymerase-binding transcription factor DksA